MPFKFDIEKKLGDFQLKAKARFDDGLTGVFGKSGCGKTTLLNCLAGYTKPGQGMISLRERLLFSSENRIHLAIEQRNIGFVTQDNLLFPHLNVKNNILYGMRKDRDQRYLQRIIDRLGLNKLLDRFPKNLSGGEKQRVSMARSLLYHPSVLLMDEPVSSLDLKTRYAIMDCLKDLAKHFFIPVIYVSHSISELLYLVNKILILEDGRSVNFGDPLNTFMDYSLKAASQPFNMDNVYKLKVSDYQKEEGLVSLDFYGNPLVVAYDLEGGEEELFLHVNSRDIIVANQKPKGISARNIIQATIEHIYQFGSKVVLQTSVGQGCCFVQITPVALKELKLKKHQEVSLIIKAKSLMVLNS